jgi:hypothetical protein
VSPKPRARPPGGAAALWSSIGFAVSSPRGPLGVVEDTVRIPGLKRPAALAVRTGRGRVVLVPVTDVVEVDTEARAILLREDPDAAPDGR